MDSRIFPNRQPAEPVVTASRLPNPLQPPEGPSVVSPAEWPQAAGQWKALIVDHLYGCLPTAPESIQVEALCHAVIWRLPGQPRCFSYRVRCFREERYLGFCVRVFLPSSPGPHPVVINGDGCWWYVTDEVVQAVLGSGCALMLFNRTEFAEDTGNISNPLPKDFLPKGRVSDHGKAARRGGLYDFCVESDFGAISAWAWGYQRCVDLVQQLPFLDASRIAVTGHSRGGKAALLAGATDDRVALVNDNASGAGGSSLSKYVGDGGETLESVLSHFPAWFRQNGPQGREALPFDQHCLLATLSPRPVRLTYAVDDRWSNPEGMVLSIRAAGRVYSLFGVPENLAFHLREGIHTHAPEDWKALIDFVRWKWMEGSPPLLLNRHPYSHLPGSDGTTPV